MRSDSELSRCTISGNDSAGSSNGFDASSCVLYSNAVL